ncbi:hypothetical protein MTO96_005057 [Rhipicephalus appendiculatus]
MKTRRIRIGGGGGAPDAILQWQRPVSAREPRQDTASQDTDSQHAASQDKEDDAAKDRLRKNEMCRMLCRQNLPVQKVPASNSREQLADMTRRHDELAKAYGVANATVDRA